jgi:MFS family permease
VQAAQHASLLLLGVAIGSLAIGMISDRLGSRTGVLRVAVLLYALSWLPWLLHADWPTWATLGWFLLMGLLIPGFTLSWTIAKEAHPPAYAGIATSVVNVGIFLGTGLMQPLVGWVLDRGRAAGDAAGAWDRGIACMAGAAALAAVVSWFVRQRRPAAAVSAA